MKTACIIPAYNEESSIGQVVQDVFPLVDEVIVVDDCSTDHTFRLAHELGAKVIRHPINRGQGAALQTGNDYALAHGADLIVHFDADGQFKSSEIPTLLAPIIRGEADAVFGSRFLGSANFPFSKRFIIMPLARLVNRIFGVKLSDPQSGFRAMNRDTAKKIRIENRGMAHCSEILHKVSRSGAKIIEVPIHVSYQRFGQGFSGGLKIIKDLIINNFIQ